VRGRRGNRRRAAHDNRGKVATVSGRVTKTYTLSGGGVHEAVGQIKAEVRDDDKDLSDVKKVTGEPLTSTDEVPVSVYGSRSRARE
jgi:hypothetical protein